MELKVLAPQFRTLLTPDFLAGKLQSARLLAHKSKSFTGSGAPKSPIRNISSTS